LAVPELGVLGFVFPFLEENGRFVVARHHQLQDTRLAPLCPFENFIYQQAAYAMLTVCRGRPHGNKMRSRWIVLVEEREAAMPHAISPSSATNPAPLSPFICSIHVSHLESENCDPLAKVEPNTCGASCNARRRTALKTRAFNGVIGLISINRAYSSVFSRHGTRKHLLCLR